ncbi:MAG: protein-L-isoaspartate(D-aspartate) O-methyltransferase [Burkholderiales bacterium]
MQSNDITRACTSNPSWVRTFRTAIRSLLQPVAARAAGALIACVVPDDSAAGEQFEALRARMVAEIAGDAKATAAYTGRPAFSERVMAAMRKVERHRFVPTDQGMHAYENRPLPIGAGQTISQPYIVALMTDMLDLKPTDVVLEIGTGSGYQAAVLAELVQHVYTIEIVETVGRQGARALAGAGYRNVTTRIGDGYQGWPERAPFDAIIVTAAPAAIPEPLIRQLKPSGRMIVPVGPTGSSQELMLVEKQADGSTKMTRTLPVRFVPLTRTPATK